MKKCVESKTGGDNKALGREGGGKGDRINRKKGYLKEDKRRGDQVSQRVL